MICHTALKFIKSLDIEKKLIIFELLKIPQFYVKKKGYIKLLFYFPLLPLIYTF